MFQLSRSDLLLHVHKVDNTISFCRDSKHGKMHHHHDFAVRSCEFHSLNIRSFVLMKFVTTLVLLVQLNIKQSDKVIYKASNANLLTIKLFISEGNKIWGLTKAIKFYFHWVPFSHKSGSIHVWSARLTITEIISIASFHLRNNHPNRFCINQNVNEADGNKLDGEKLIENLMPTGIINDLHSELECSQ